MTLHLLCLRISPVGETIISLDAVAVATSLAIEISARMPSVWRSYNTESIFAIEISALMPAIWRVCDTSSDSSGSQFLPPGHRPGP